jgi:glycosyltransferase involved in cell wall biosynthesis
MTDGSLEPLVSIGIPTYQRARSLARALASARAQSYPNLEIVISDNASEDDTAAICRAAVEHDDRVTYLRSDRNVGPTANFNKLFAACRGEFVLMLADDDRLEPGYVDACVARLRSSPELSLVAGRARYLHGEQPVSDGQWHRHLEPTPEGRVLAYLSTVTDNGVFYGVVRGDALRRAGPMPNVLGNDWLHVARIAAQGGLEMIDTVRIERELGGTSVDVQSILATFGRGGWQGRIPQLVIAWEILRDVAAGGPAYAAIPARRRIRLAIRVSWASVDWSDLAWHLLTPTVAHLARRSRGRVIWRLYDRATRALGAGGGSVPSG